MLSYYQLKRQQKKIFYKQNIMTEELNKRFKYIVELKFVLERTKITFF